MKSATVNNKSGKEQQFEVASIKASKVDPKTGETLYLVDWVPTWEPIGNLSHAMNAVHIFLNNNKDNDGSGPSGSGSNPEQQQQQNKQLKQLKKKRATARSKADDDAVMKQPKTEPDNDAPAADVVTQKKA